MNYLDNIENIENIRHFYSKLCEYIEGPYKKQHYDNYCRRMLYTRYARRIF